MLPCTHSFRLQLHWGQLRQKWGWGTHGSHDQETLKRMGVTSLKSIKLREALNLKILLSIFGRGRWGYALNIVMVGERHCTTTTSLAPVYNMKLWFLLIPFHKAPSLRRGCRVWGSGRWRVLLVLGQVPWLRDESLHKASQAPLRHINPTPHFTSGAHLYLLGFILGPVCNTEHQVMYLA